LVALRRPAFEQQTEEEIVFPATPAVRFLPRYPRWAVVCGVVLYCSTFWLVIWSVGGWALSLIHNTGGTP
jgi:hypothetical protein